MASNNNNNEASKAPLPFFTRKLTALQYPNASQPINVKDDKQFRTLVVWLEFTKIRFYPVDKRASLQNIDSPDWEKAFLTYLDDLNCPKPHHSSMLDSELTSLLEWLLSQAITAEYSDHAGEYNSLSKMWVLGSGGTQQVAHLDSTSTPQLQAAVATQLEQLCALFQMPYIKEEMPAIIRVIRKRIQDHAVEKKRVDALEKEAKEKNKHSKSSDNKNKSAASSSSSSTSSSSSSPPSSLDAVFAALNAMDLGHPTTGDTLVDRASHVLRLLFLHDLRETQSISNEIMMLCQEYTANPKTDARLGKVGI